MKPCIKLQSSSTVKSGDDSFFLNSPDAGSSPQTLPRKPTELETFTTLAWGLRIGNRT